MAAGVAAPITSADVSALRRKPCVVVTVGRAIAAHIPGARLMMPPIAIATASSVRIALKGSDWKTIQAYQRYTGGSVAGMASASRRGTELPRSVPIRTRTARTTIS